MINPNNPVPQGLQALMVLDRTASQMGPAGPTVASQMMQRFQPPPPPQGMPPQGMPPQGMPPQGPPQGPPGMMPNDPFRQQMMKTVQQQSQASAQPPQQPPQQPQRPQGMAHGGIASLRADNIARMRYAQGGVIGFANQGYVDPLGMGTAAPGEETSDTPGKKDKELLRALISMGMLPAAALDLLQAPAAAVARTSLPGVDPNKFSYTPAVSALRNALANIDKPEAPSPAPEQVARPAVEDARRREDIPPGGMVVATPGTPSAVGTRPPASPRPAAPAAGIAQLAAENPDLAILRKMRDAPPFTDQAPTPESQMELLNRFRTAQGQTGPVGSAIEAAIKANAERAAATEAAYRKGQEGQGTEEWISMLTKGKEGVGALGAEFVRGRQAQRAAEMSFRQLMDASAAKRDEMAVTLQNMREAAASGNMGAYNTAKTEYDRAKQQAADTQRQLAAKAAELSVGSQERALDRANALKVAQINHAAQALGTPEMRMAEWIKDPKNLAAYQTLINAKGEPSLIKELAKQAISNPGMLEVLKSTNQELYAQLMAEIRKGSQTGSPNRMKFDANGNPIP